MKLQDIAYIRSGLVLSRKRKKDEEGVSYPLLTLRSILPEGGIDFEELEEFEAAEKLSLEYVTSVGDIVVRLSSPYTAVLIDDKAVGMVIPSNFVLIKADSKKILPEYLYWFLNIQKMKNHMFENSTGNMLGAIKASFFNDIDIKLISLEEQKRIAEINSMAKREVYLLRRLAEEKEKYYSAMVEELVERLVNNG